MSRLEEYVRSITRDLDLPAGALRRIQSEALAHLADEQQKCRAEGMADNAAEGAAIERFGDHDVIAGMVAAALHEQQVRHRRRRALRGALGAGLLMLVGILIGAWFNIFDDAISGVRVNIPMAIKGTVYLGTWTICLAMVTMIAARIFRLKTGYMAIAMIVVLAAFFFTMYLGLFQGVVLQSDYDVHSINWPNIKKYFWMRAYLCLFPLMLISPIVLVLDHSRRTINWIYACAIIGLVSGVLWGINYGHFRSTYPWLTWMKWPKMLSTGLLTAVFMIQVGILGRAMQARFYKPTSPAASGALDGLNQIDSA